MTFHKLFPWVAILFVGGVAAADLTRVVRFDIPAQLTQSALFKFSEQTRMQVVVSADVLANKRSPAVNGELPVRDALTLLLAGTGLEFTMVNEQTVAIMSAKAAERSTAFQSADARLRLAQSESTQSSGAGGDQSTVDTERGQGLNEIVVTAQKREQSVIDVPMSVAVLSDEQLERSGIGSLEDVAQNTPSVTVLKQGPGNSTFMMRGVGNFAGTSPLVGIYFDEISLAKGGLYGGMDLRVFDLERIEVLKGPQGTLYGEGSVGGTIRMISKDPQFDGLSGKMDVAKSFTKGGESSDSIRGVLNLPVIDDVLGFRVVATYEDTGGWVDIPAEPRRNANDTDALDARIKGLWRPAEGLEIRGTFMIHKSDHDVFVAGATADYDLTLVLPGHDFSGFNDYRIGNVTATYDLGPIELLSTTSYIHEEKDWQTNQFVRLSVFPPAPFPPAGLISGSDQDVRTFSQELRLSSHSDGALTWNAGVYYRDLKTHDLNSSTFALAGTVLSQTQSEATSTSKAWALFGNSSYAITDRLELGVGVRFFRDRQDIARPTSVITEDDANFHSFNPRAYLSYELNERSTVYVNVAKGFRSGGFNTEGDPPYKPEKLISYELGLKSSLLASVLQAEVAAFWSDYEDAQTIATVTRPDNTLFNVLANVGKARIKGIELSLDWHPIDKLNLGVTGSVIDSEITSLGGSIAASHEVGDPLDLVPKYSFRLSGQYDLQWAAAVSGFLRIDYTQQGKSTSTNLSSGLVPPRSRSDVIGLLNARLNAQWRDWYGELYGENLLKENDNADSWSFIGLNNRPRPLTFGVRLGKNF